MSDGIDTNRGGTNRAGTNSAGTNSAGTNSVDKSSAGTNTASTSRASRRRARRSRSGTNRADAGTDKTSTDNPSNADMSTAGKGSADKNTVDTSRVTVSVAAKMTGIDRRVVRRYLETGNFPQAERAPGVSGAPTGPWMIAVDDLRAIGLLPSDPGEGRADPWPPTDADPEVQRLRIDLAAALRRAEAAEAAVLECERLIESQRRTQVEQRALAEQRLLSEHQDREAQGTAGQRANRRSHTDDRPAKPLDAGTDDDPVVDPTPSEPAASERTDVGGEPGYEPGGTGPGADGAEPEHPDRAQGAGTEPLRPSFTPRFAASWASAPPWEASPAASSAPPRRWWRRAR